MDSLVSLLENSSTIICVGSGGVGKTTTAAAMGLKAAQLNKKACVVTIDPAKRLANALGIENLDNEPKQIMGNWSGELWALMLDTKTTFDSVVQKYSTSSDQSESIFNNRFYKNLSQALSGTQEYMAAEKLYELQEDGKFDIVIVDTPPTRNALDFINAPRQLVRLLDNKVFRVVMLPTKAYLKLISSATQTFLKSISKVVGSEVVTDAITFFQAFEGMEKGFKERAEKVSSLLSDSHTSFILVTSPRTDSIDEALFFTSKLSEISINADALIINRLHSNFFPIQNKSGSVGKDQKKFENITPSQAKKILDGFKENLSQLEKVSEKEQQAIKPLLQKIAPAPTVQVPLISQDIHDIEGLEFIAKFIFD